MSSALWGMIVLVYRSVVGKLWSKITSESTSKMYYTSNRYETTIELSGLVIHFRSIQLKVVTHYKPWWLRSRIGCLYEVTMEAVQDGNPQRLRTLVLPHMCPKMLRKTEFPHKYAIEVCIDLWSNQLKT